MTLRVLYCTLTENLSYQESTDYDSERASSLRLEIDEIQDEELYTKTMVCSKFIESKFCLGICLTTGTITSADLGAHGHYAGGRSRRRDREDLG